MGRASLLFSRKRIGFMERGENKMENVSSTTNFYGNVTGLQLQQGAANLT